MIISLIILGAVFRIYSNATGFDFFPPNFAPIGAMALFGGYFLPKKQGLIIPILTMLFSDLVIGFYEPLIMVAVYVSFIFINLVGRYLQGRKPKIILGGVLTSSLLFFLITNAAVWVNPGSSYPNGLEGLLESYIAGLPFLKFTIMGDLFFSGLFFVSYLFSQQISRKRIYLKYEV